MQFNLSSNATCQKNYIKFILKMMRCPIKTTLLVFAIPVLCCAQDTNSLAGKRPLNSIGISVIADASLIATGYERIVLNRKKFFLAMKMGIGYNENILEQALNPLFNKFYLSIERVQVLTIPHQLTGNIGTRKGYFEIGAGGAYFVGNVSRTYTPYPIVGYRHYPLKKPAMFFRVFNTFPFYDYVESAVYYFPIGFNLGLSL